MPFNLFLASLRDYFTREHPPAPRICTCSPPEAQWVCSGVMEKWRRAVVSHTPNRMGLSGREGVRVEFCFGLEAQVIGVTLLLLQTRLPHVDHHHPQLAKSTPLVLYGRGQRQGSCSRLACRWHVVNLPGLRGK